MMVQLSEGLAVDCELWDLAPLRDHCVVGLVLGDRHVEVHDVADQSELLGPEAGDLVELLLGGLDPLLDLVGLGLLLLQGDAQRLPHTCPGP